MAPKTPPLPKVRGTEDPEVAYHMHIGSYFGAGGNPLFTTNGAHSEVLSSAGQTLQKTMTKLQELQSKFGKNLKIIDAIPKPDTTRTSYPDENDPMVGSRHFHGDALDLYIADLSSDEKDQLIMDALEVGFTGFGFGPTTLHVDLKPAENRFWTYFEKNKNPNYNAKFGSKTISEWGKIVKGFNGPTNYGTNSSPMGSGDPGYPVLEERMEIAKGAVAGSLTSLATSLFPGSVESAVSGVLSQSLGDIPQVATLAKEIVGPGLQGEGIPTITSAISRISAPDTLAGRIQESISLAQENRELVKVLAPQFESLLDFDQMGAFDRLRAIYTAAEESNVKIDALEQLDQTLQKTQSIETPLKTLLFNPTEGSVLVTSLAQGILSENINQQNHTFNIINRVVSIVNKEYGELAGNLTKPIDEILQNPQIQTMLESLPQLDPLRGTSEEVQERLGEMAVSEIAGETGLGKADTRTLVLGSENPEEVKKLRESAGGLVLDDFIESNPTLKAIIDFFTNNKEIITLLGTTGAVAGLSSLLGGGMFGGFAAGAGAFAATRIALGEDGFNELQSMIKVAGEPVFNFVDEMLKSSGLSEIPVLGDVLTQISTIGRDNPLALATGLTGNFGGAAGLLAASAVTDFFDSDNSISDIFEYINAPAIPSYDYGFVGNGRMPMYPDYSGNQSLPRGAQGEPMQGGTNVTGLYVPGIHTNANDLGSHNTGSLLGAAGSQ
tara:strand:+ start:2867 stop:5035 length:2169 start_codon:yes stop_codon:yes gene_type:complete